MKRYKSKLSRMIGHTIGNKVLIAKQLPIFELDEKVEKFTQNHSVTFKRQLIATSSHSILDTVEMSAHNPIKNPSFIVFIWGRACAFENHLEFMAKVVNDLQIKGISFNFRGVGHSIGELYSENDLIQDGYFQVMRLINQGVDPSMITVYGHSLGGAVATRVVSLLHQAGFEVQLFCDRTFSSLVDATVYRFFNKPKTLMSRFFEKMTRRLMQDGWEMHVVSAYEKIPEKYKRHTVIQGAGQDGIAFAAMMNLSQFNSNHEDMSIPYSVSLHNSLTLQNEMNAKYTVMGLCPNAHMAYLECLLPVSNTTYTNALDSLYDFIRQS